VYFAVRFLQLRHNIPDGEFGIHNDDRSTIAMLDRLIATIPDDSHLVALRSGYAFLSTLDHNLRLTIGRTTRLSTGNQVALAIIAERMNLESPAALLEHLTLVRLAIRDAFDAIVA